MNSQERKQVAATIVQQMGGFGKLKAMVNGRDWSTLEDGGLKFTFSGKRGVNKCLVHLNADDTYTMEFWYCKLNKKTYEFKSEMKASFDGLYWDMLISTFEKFTGLYLSLGTMGR